jgi:hypothetical protein
VFSVDTRKRGEVFQESRKGGRRKEKKAARMTGWMGCRKKNDVEGGIERFRRNLDMKYWILASKT